MNIASLLDKAQQMMAVAFQLKTEAQSYLQKLPGFSFDETMAGPITLDGSQHPRHMEFRIHAEVPSLGEYLEEGRTDIAGTVSISGFADSAALSGSLWILPLQRQIRYEFGFAANDGSPYRFAGQKDISPLDPVTTLTVLPAYLYDAHGRETGQAEVRFALGDLPSFLASWRPVLAGNSRR
ncbi:MAG TPA: hypothetical protein PKO07_12965 [Pseudomonadota bacterium]|mgnify:FL=1|jgi:hypothetical protein|nr:hypothetical protein [Pseudomonadota bacterium]HNN51929.1 hypothetical protein [Pseudomonadota bacterium]